MDTVMKIGGGVIIGVLLYVLFFNGEKTTTPLAFKGLVVEVVPLRTNPVPAPSPSATMRPRAQPWETYEDDGVGNSRHRYHSESSWHIHCVGTVCR